MATHAGGSSGWHAGAAQNLGKRLTFLGRERHVDRLCVEQMRSRVRTLSGEIGFAARHDHAVVREEVRL